MPVPPVARDAITQALRELGPMSAEEIAEATGLPRGKVNASLTNARANHPGKFFPNEYHRKVTAIKNRLDARA